MIEALVGKARCKAFVVSGLQSFVLGLQPDIPILPNPTDTW